jgi:hypothetical protein
MIKVMKNKVILITIVYSIIAICGYGFFRTLTENDSYNKRIGMNLPKDSIILIEEDGHGGFHGDGEYYSEVQLTEDAVKEFVNNASKAGEWLSYPLPKDIEILLYGGKYMGTDYQIGEKSKNIPKDIKDGIYYVKDRLAERNPNMKNINIITRGSYNVTISILDPDTKKLFIYKLDT